MSLQSTTPSHHLVSGMHQGSESLHILSPSKHPPDCSHEVSSDKSPHCTEPSHLMVAGIQDPSAQAHSSRPQPGYCIQYQINCNWCDESYYHNPAHLKNLSSERPHHSGGEHQHNPHPDTGIQIAGTLGQYCNQSHQTCPGTVGFHHTCSSEGCRILSHSSTRHHDTAELDRGLHTDKLGGDITPGQNISSDPSGH